jgi:copper homeostasis protein
MFFVCHNYTEKISNFKNIIIKKSYLLARVCNLCHTTNTDYIPIVIGTALSFFRIYYMKFKLEICVDSVESAITAQEAGADRVELCNNLPEGGTTPGFGTIASARSNLTIGLHVIIRPRGGDFLYTDLEYDIMRRDIECCGELGADGIVLGILRSDGEIDIERTARLIEFAQPMSATFHRAFDLCPDPLKGLEDVIVTGANRLLTSGQKDKAQEGTVLLNQLVMKAGNRIIIMPGSGINNTNISDIVRETGALEFHMTARKIIESEMIFRQQGVSMGSVKGMSEFSRKVADPDMIRDIINTLNHI